MRDKSRKKQNPEVQQLVRKLPELFTRKGRVKINEVKFKMKNIAKITPQK